MKMKGGSTGHAPIYVKIKKILIKNQNSILVKGYIHNGRNLLCIEIGKVKITIIERKRAITPPSLFGILRRIA